MRAISSACLLMPLLVALGVSAAPGDAAAVDLFINNENVTGIRNVTLVNARVRIDDRGNVYVDAPGYTVRRMDVVNPPVGGGSPGGGAVAPGGRPSAPAAGGGAAAPAPLTRRYYIVTSQTGPSQYDLEVFVNGVSVGRSPAEGEPLIDLLNRSLRPGRNEIRVVARKSLGQGGRRSQSRNHVHRVLIGEGTESQGQVTLDVTLVDYSVNASQVEDQSAVFTITAR